MWIHVKERGNHVSIRLRILSLTVLAGLVLLVLSGVKEYSTFRRQLVQDNSRLLSDARGTFDAMLKANLANLSLTVKTIAENHETAALFAAGDREGLLRLYHDYFTSASAEFAIDQFQFHLPPATSFLRLHQVDKYGDDLSKFRKTVVQANQDRKAVIGLEVGRGGPGTRAVYPVSYEGRFIGTVELGGSIAGILKDMQDIFNVDFAVGIFSKVFEQASRFEAGKKDVIVGDTVFYAYSSDFAQGLTRQFRPGRSDYLIQGHRYFAATFPIRDYSGAVAGQILIIKDQTSMVAELRRSLLVSLGLIVVLIVAIVVALSVSIGRVLSPMKNVVAVMGGIAAGDLSMEITANGKRDEIGRVLSSAGAMVENLREAMGSIQLAAVRLTTTSEEIAASAGQLASGAQNQASTLEETSASVEELSASLDQVRDHAQSQSTAIEQGTRSMMEVEGSLHGVSGSLNEISHLSRASVENAVQGSKAVDSVVTGISRIADGSEKIAGIVTVISDIADQTNLLALNASIEAARAGEHGRGFAVVADEVSKLADRSASSTKEIAALIKESVKNVQEGVETAKGSQSAMEQIRAASQRVSEMISGLTEAMGQQLSAIHELSQSLAGVSERSRSISAATEEQSANTRQVSRAVENVNELTQQAAGAAEQMSTATVELSTLSQELQRQVDRFKVSGRDAADLTLHGRQPAPAQKRIS
jgi:methyl-accepting chemotaxis protein